MIGLLHELPAFTAQRAPNRQALTERNRSLNYAELVDAVQAFAATLLDLRLKRYDRVAVFLPKQLETVIALFGTARAGCVFVPINPILKAPQVEHILRDCNVRLLVTSPDRLAGLASVLPHCPDLRDALLVGDGRVESSLNAHSWTEIRKAPHEFEGHRVIDADMAAILYTSGSTGKPKGVVLSHRNLVTGARSVAQYLENRENDRLLAVLPLSFDYGLSQLTSAFLVGASVVLLDHLFPRDVVNAVAKERITGLAAVPPLWAQLADLKWPEEANESLRYFTNSGGTMPEAVLKKLRASLPKAKPFLMYGLTEAFRSTYLPPEEIDNRPGSIGKAIPNAEVLVVRPNGEPCAVNEPGELVHRGSLVALGYWNDPEKTAERFRPVPSPNAGLTLTEIAVWSGDTVRRDENGFLYFLGRRDEMIKTSGYRVSPSEIEEIAFASGLVSDAVAVGIPHPTLGQAIALVYAANPAQDPSQDSSQAADAEILLETFKKQLPAFMVPAHLERRSSVPRNANGKYDRQQLSNELKDLFAATTP